MDTDELAVSDMPRVGTCWVAGAVESFKAILAVLRKPEAAEGQESRALGQGSGGRPLPVFMTSVLWI